jgi:hypothetical protein
LLLAIYLKKESGTSELSLLSDDAKNYFLEMLKKDPEKRIVNHMLINLIGEHFYDRKHQNKIQKYLLNECILSKNNSKELNLFEKLFADPLLFIFSYMLILVISIYSPFLHQLGIIILLGFIAYMLYNRLTMGNNFSIFSETKQKELLSLLEEDSALVFSKSKLLVLSELDKLDNDSKNEEDNDSKDEFKDCEPVVSYACYNKKQQEIIQKLSFKQDLTKHPID